jgi:DNA-binding transcriptional ArsR family regulator
MKRDMELIRKILVSMEAHAKTMGFVALQFDGYSDDEVSYHIKLLADHGLIEATDCSTQYGFCWRARRLRWEGHDLIEAIREESRWNSLKKWVTDAGKILTIETLKEAVKALFL